MYNFFQKKKIVHQNGCQTYGLSRAVFMGKQEELMEKVKSTKHHQPP